MICATIQPQVGGPWAGQLVANEVAQHPTVVKHLIICTETS